MVPCGKKKRRFASLHNSFLNFTPPIRTKDKRKYKEEETEEKRSVVKRERGKERV